MESAHSASAPQGAARKLLASIAVLLAFLAVTSADVLSLDPDPPRECEPLTVRWAVEPPAVVIVFDRSELATPPQMLFRKIVNARTGSLEWVVNAAGGASIEISLSMDSLGREIGMRAERQVQPAVSPCFAVRNALSVMYVLLCLLT